MQEHRNGATVGYKRIKKKTDSLPYMGGYHGVIRRGTKPLWECDHHHSWAASDRDSAENCAFAEMERRGWVKDFQFTD